MGEKIDHADRGIKARAPKSISRGSTQKRKNQNLDVRRRLLESELTHFGPAQYQNPSDVGRFYLSRKHYRKSLSAPFSIYYE